MSTATSLTANQFVRSISTSSFPEPVLTAHRETRVPGQGKRRFEIDSLASENEIVEMFQVTLIIATLLCTLVAGVVFAFAVVVMPGLRTLSDGEFLRAFQVMDRVTQNNQPVFMLVWIGSAVALVAAAILGFGQFDATGRVLVVSAAIVYVLGVQLLTVAINISLNNRVQGLSLADMDETTKEAARRAFEARWNYSNLTRTVLASVVAVLLMIVLVRL